MVFSFDNELAGALKTSVEARWSAILGCSYIPYKAGVLNRLLTIYKGRAWLDYTFLSEKVAG